jgi:hypothetical protein
MIHFEGRAALSQPGARQQPAEQHVAGRQSWLQFFSPRAGREIDPVQGGAESSGGFHGGTSCVKGLRNVNAIKYSPDPENLQPLDCNRREGRRQTVFRKESSAPR